MPVLREVITRFKFETDEQAARKVDQRVNKMKRGIGGIGKVLGISLGIAGAKALFNFGQSGTRAKLVLDNLAGTKFEPLRQRMLKIKKDLDDIKTGAGGIFTEREYNIAAAGFIRTLGTGEEKLKLFDLIFRSAAKQTGITKQNIVELTQQFTQAVSGGYFSALLNFPGIDQSTVKLIEDINAELDPGEIGGQAAILQRMRVLTRELEKARGQQNQALKKIPPELFLEQVGQKVIAEKTHQLAEKANRALALGAVKTAEQVKEKGLLGAFQESIKSLGATQKEERLKRIEDLRKGKTTSGLSRDVRAAQQLGPLPGGEKSPIFNITISVDGAGDPELVGKIVEKKVNDIISGALQSVIPTEDR